MNSLTKFNIYNMSKHFRENKPLIEAYLKGHKVEGLDSQNKKIMGLNVAIFLIFFVIHTIIWIWSLIALITFWKQLPVWAKVFGLLGIFGVGIGPIITLIVVYVSKNNKTEDSSSSMRKFSF